MAEGFIGGTGTSLTGVSMSIRVHTVSSFVARSTRVGISGRVALAKGPKPDSTLDDVFGDCEGPWGPDAGSLNPCRGDEGKLLRSEQTSSISNGSAGPGSKFLLSVALLLVMGPLLDVLILRL